MGHKKRKLSDLTVGDRNALLVALDTFQDNLDEDDEDLPSGLLSALAQVPEKRDVAKVSFRILWSPFLVNYQPVWYAIKPTMYRNEINKSEFIGSTTAYRIITKDTTRGSNESLIPRRR